MLGQNKTKVVFRPPRERSPLRTRYRSGVRRITIIIPPLYRLLGSSHKRLPPGAGFDAGLLKAHGHQVKFVHCDAPLGSSPSRSWAELYASTGDLSAERLAASFDALWPELRERVLATNPQRVIVFAADWVEPAKDFCDAAVSLMLGRALRRLGLPTIAVGGLPSRFPKLFDQVFSATIIGPPGKSLLRALRRTKGTLTGEGAAAYKRVRPQITGADVALDLSQTTTEWGCHYGKCSFCPISQMYGAGAIRRPLEFVAADVASRPERRINLVDACFGWDPARLRAVAGPFAGLGKDYVASTRAQYLLQPETLDLFRAMGVTTVKIGVESLSDAMLAYMGKGQTVSEVVAQLGAVHDAGFHVFGYLLLGSPGETPATLAETLHRARQLGFVKWLPNIFCALNDASPAAHHFSQAQAKRLELPEELVGELFEIAVKPPQQQGQPTETTATYPERRLQEVMAC